MVVSAETRNVLHACANELEDLSRRNREISATHTAFYTRQMIAKMAQTYKHAAAYLRSVANGEQSIRPAPSDDQPSVDCPTASSLSCTEKHHPPPPAEYQMNQDILRSAKGSTGQPLPDQVGS